MFSKISFDFEMSYRIFLKGCVVGKWISRSKKPGLISFQLIVEGMFKLKISIQVRPIKELSSYAKHKDEIQKKFKWEIVILPHHFARP